MKYFRSLLPRTLLLALLLPNDASSSSTIRSVAIDPSATTLSEQYQYIENRRRLQNDDETIIIFFHGTVLNDLWEPIEGAQVQFWQTDKRGVYNHPQDLKSRDDVLELLPDFQYFGTSTSDREGKFDFITYRPGIYESRPITHIHYKVFVEGSPVLTSQFYFADEQQTQFSNLMTLELTPILPQSTDDATAMEYFRTQNNAPTSESKTSASNTTTTTASSSTRYFQTFKTIIVDMNLGGMMGTTPSQTEGPFYPVVDFFDMDYDLTRPDRPHNTGTIQDNPNSASGTISYNPITWTGGASSRNILFWSAIIATIAATAESFWC